MQQILLNLYTWHGGLSRRSFFYFREAQGFRKGNWNPFGVPLEPCIEMIIKYMVSQTYLYILLNIYWIKIENETRVTFLGQKSKRFRYNYKFANKFPQNEILVAKHF